jgi:hypothetical protein
MMEDDKFEPIGTIPVVGDRVCDIDNKKYADRLVVDATGDQFEDPDGGFWDDEPFRYGTYRVYKRTESEEKSPETEENIQILPESDLFSLAADRIGIRQDGYGPENAFQDIADRVSLWIKQRFGVELSLTSSDAADMLSEFKQARRLVRLRAGIIKGDDTVDQTGYVWWRNKLEEE